MKVTDFTTVATAIENKDFIEIYNSYAVWIKDNMWAWRTGANPARTSLHMATRNNGLTAFAKAYYNFQTTADVAKFQRQSSDFLKNHPELLKEKADIFAATFPNVIKSKIKKKNQREEQKEKITNSILNRKFEIEDTTQMELPVNETSNTISSDLSELAQTICAFAERGAKSVKTPDGWEVQF